MEIIIEYVLLDNLLIDGILLFCTNKILKIPINWWGIVGASIFGALFALFSPLLNFDGVVLIIIKLLIATTMVLICNLTLYKIVLRIVCFVLFTFLFGGMLIAICYFAGINVINGASLMYFSTVPIGSILGCGIVFVALITKLIKTLFAHLKFSQYLTTITLTINNKTIQLPAFFDSGNNLCTKDNTPIVIIREDELKHWFSSEQRLNILMGRYDLALLKNPQKINISSVGANAEIVVFDADNICVNNRDFDVAVGIDNSRHFKNFAVLLNNKMGEFLC